MNKMTVVKTYIGKEICTTNIPDGVDTKIINECILFNSSARIEKDE